MLLVVAVAEAAEHLLIMDYLADRVAAVDPLLEMAQDIFIQGRHNRVILVAQGLLHRNMVVAVAVELVVLVQLEPHQQAEQAEPVIHGR